MQKSKWGFLGIAMILCFGGMKNQELQVFLFLEHHLSLSEDLVQRDATFTSVYHGLLVRSLS